MRYKVDWASIDPAGRAEDGNGILQNGGAICDVVLNVHNDNGALEVVAENGALLAADGSALPETVAFGKELELKAVPADGYILDYVKVLHGHNFNGNEILHGVMQYSEEFYPGYNVKDGVLVLPAEYVDGDVMLTASFVKACNSNGGDGYALSFDKDAAATNMANTIYTRTSLSNIMTNLFDNVKYTLGSTIGSSPTLYATYQLAQMLKQTTGGINIPFINAMGFGVDLNATVADLMNVGVLGGSILGGIGKMITGLAKGSGGGFSGSGMLKAFGVSDNLDIISRGTGDGLLTTSKGGADTSASTYVGNTDGSDVKNKTLTDANNDANQQLVEASEDTNETKLSTVDEHIVQIYQLLKDVTTGASSLHVIPEGYGLT
jgi:hypothetical protein